MINTIMVTLGCLAVIVILFWYLITYMRRGPIVATIYFKDGEVLEYKRIFRTFSEYDEWADETIEIDVTHGPEPEIKYIDFKYVNKNYEFN